MTGREQRGGGERIIIGLVENRFWGGLLWYVFPSPEFPHPLFSLQEEGPKKLDVKPSSLRMPKAGREV